MISREQVLDTYEAVVEQACNFRKEGKEVTTTFFLVLPDRTVIVPASMAQTDSKQQLVAFVRATVAYMGARYVIHVGEAWVSMIADGKAPSEQPDRTEVILVTVEGPGLRRIATIPILPDNTLGERTESNEFGGLFTNFTDSEEDN